MADNDLQLSRLTLSPGRRLEQVIQAIHAAIEDGSMRPGVKYSVYQLAEQLGVSRTPVRDALLRLEEAGLIQFEARQGFRILLPQPREIADIFAVRLALEVPAVKHAAIRATISDCDALAERMDLMRRALNDHDETVFAAHDILLHDHILQIAGNQRARKIVQSLRESTRLLGASTADRSRTLTDIDAEHIPIVHAIAAGHPDAAEEAMRTHLLSTGWLLVSQAARADQLEELDADEIWHTALAD